MLFGLVHGYFWTNPNKITYRLSFLLYCTGISGYFFAHTGLHNKYNKLC